MKSWYSNSSVYIRVKTSVTLTSNQIWSPCSSLILSTSYNYAALLHPSEECPWWITENILAPRMWEIWIHFQVDIIKMFHSNERSVLQRMRGLHKRTKLYLRLPYHRIKLELNVCCISTLTEMLHQRIIKPGDSFYMAYINCKLYICIHACSHILK
jgi:hypothetical protein